MANKNRSARSEQNKRDYRNRGGRNGKPNNGNGKRGPRREDTNIEEVKAEGGHTNPPDDGFDSVELFNQTMTLGFQTILGDTFVDAGYREPTIMKIAMNASPGTYQYVNEAGTLTHERDGLNMAITDLYTTLSAFSGRATSYAPQDVGTLILAMGSIIEHIEYWRRAVGVARVYNERNETMPLRLLEAMGVTNAVNFAGQISLYIDRLNTAITSFNTLPIFENIKYLTRSRDFYQKLYWDAPLLTAQVEFTAPASYWLIDETTYSGGTILHTVDTPVISSPTDLGYIITMIDAILNSSTYQIIRSDLLNIAAKFKTPMWKMEPVDYSYSVLPEYDPSWNLRLHNATPMGKPTYATFSQSGGQTITPLNDVYPDPNSNQLLYSPAFARNSALQQWSDVIIDMPVENPTPADIYEATRLISMSGWSFQDAQNNIWAINAVLADHYITDVVIYDGTLSNRTVIDATHYVFPFGTGGSLSVLRHVANITSAYSHFANHPRLVLLDNDASSKPYEMWDVNFFTHCDIHKLRRMNRLNFQGLFKFRM